jgi:hypothetical protein
LGLGRLHETFRFISVTSSRTVSSTPWTGDQLVARTLLTSLGDCDGEFGGMNGFGRGSRSTRRKPARRGGKPATNRFSYIELLNETQIYKLNSASLVRKQNMPIERPPLVGEVSASLRIQGAASSAQRFPTVGTLIL